MTILAAIQLCSTPDVEQNLATIHQQLQALRQQYQSEQLVVVLPECCLLFGGQDAAQLTLAKQNAQSQWLINSLSALAKQHQVVLVAGSIPLLASSADKFTNSCCVFNEQGQVQAQYNKIHLFDVDVNTDINSNANPEIERDSNAYCESTYTQAGDSCTVTPIADSDNAVLGLSICYDLRFPELYRNLTRLGATIITVPSAFTKVTGQAHWQALLQARAIENQVYIIAAGQQGKHQNGRETWGHSMIINPWGEVLDSIENGVGYISAPYNAQELQQLRAAMPVARHNKFTSQLSNN